MSKILILFDSHIVQAYQTGFAFFLPFGVSLIYQRYRLALPPRPLRVLESAGECCERSIGAYFLAEQHER
jgi:hypothetical protein